jgi:hypothetical protein
MKSRSVPSAPHLMIYGGWIRFLCKLYCEFKLNVSIIFEFANNILIWLYHTYAHLARLGIGAKRHIDLTVTKKLLDHH